jgi:3-dehydroquinate dehydratase II
VASKKRSPKTPGVTRIHAVLVLSGPNLHLLGARETKIYGRLTLAQIHEQLEQVATERGCRIDCRQSNHEGALVDWIGNAKREHFDGLIINPGAYTHTSIALLDAIRAASLPTVELHLSNPDAREPFRHRSMIAAACLGRVAGFGPNSYAVALRALLDHLDAQR